MSSLAEFRKFWAKTLQIMKGRLPDQNQRNLFQPDLNQIKNPAHELLLLADKIDWNYFENEFSPVYATKYGFADSMKR